MKKSKNEELVQMEKEIKELPEMVQWAIYWVIENIILLLNYARIRI